MKRALALVERDMRKFRRSPALIFASLVMPLMQLIILGNAFGGNIKNVILGVVNLDRWTCWSGSAPWEPTPAPSFPPITTTKAPPSGTCERAY